MLKILNCTYRRLPTLFTEAVPPITRRFYATPPKRFYKQTGVLGSDGQYEVILDSKKLKTPNGSPFLLRSEPLAIAVAAEWDAQKNVIDRSKMHLTALCSTAIDNPNHLKKEDNVTYMLNYLSTDTILYHSYENQDLYNLQCSEWDPIIEWFNQRYETDIQKSHDINEPSIGPGTRMKIGRHLLSYNEAAIHGFVFSVDTLKSLMLTMACMDKYISVERAVALARLEEEFQLKFWGRVEWAHDLNQQDSQARVAAAVLFVHFNTNENLLKQKLVV